MSTGYRPVRRLRQKTCVPVDVAALARKLPCAGHAPSCLSVRVHWQSPRLDVNSLWRSFTGADVLATVASFLAVRHLARLLVSEKYVCNFEGLWEMLLRQVSHAVYAARVRSARANLSKMMHGTVCIWPADEPTHGYIPSGRLSNYRWCLDFCYRGCPVFSAMVPVTDLSARDLRDLHSLHRADSSHHRRVANLLPLHRLPWSVRGLLRAAWTRRTDPVPHSPRWWRVLQRRDLFDRHTMECSLWLFDTRSREVVAGICRDAYWGAYSGIFRFYISEVFEWVGVDRDLDPAAANYMAGHVLEIWVPFRCTSNVEGAYDLSCSVEVFVADGTLYPGDPITGEVLRGRNPAEDPPLVWERRPATPWDLFFALSGCALRSAVPHVGV